MFSRRNRFRPQQDVKLSIGKRRSHLFLYDCAFGKTALARMNGIPFISQQQPPGNSQLCPHRHRSTAKEGFVVELHAFGVAPLFVTLCTIYNTSFVAPTGPKYITFHFDHMGQHYPPISTSCRHLPDRASTIQRSCGPAGTCARRWDLVPAPRRRTWTSTSGSWAGTGP